MDLNVSSVVRETDKDRLIRAIHAKRKVRVRFFSKEEGTYITRVCAPMDYGRSRHAMDFRNKLHVWDYETSQPLALDQSHVEELTVLDETFDPAEFVTPELMASPWTVKRDWGTRS
ncbi:Uncharacterised protein [uncultured archaeon]|nr:Uncharacterised protein [uncultured archaeon]